MKGTTLKILATLVLAGTSVSGVMAQNSMPAPGSGGSFTPAPAYPAPGSGPAWGGGPGFGPNWGSPWYGSFAPVYVNTNVGFTNVVGCGYDSMGVWRTVPMRVHYAYNGLQYNVVVINAWNPWTDFWNTDIDVPAVNTSYYLNGTTYNFYVVLSTGTYYFNL